MLRSGATVHTLSLRQFSSSAGPPLQNEALRLLRGATFLQRHFESFMLQGGMQTLQPSVHVASSTVCNERGLFASADLEPGQLVGLYPVHAVGVAHQQGLHRWFWARDMDHYQELANNPQEQHCVQALTHKPLLEHSEQITLDGTPVPEVFIDVTPDQPLQAGWLGHMINDASACHSGEDHELLRYLSQCVEQVNCFNVPLGPAPLMASVTTRNVQKGEELLTSYLPSFWLPHAELPDSDDVSDEVDEACDELEARLVDCQRNTARAFHREASLLDEWLLRAEAEEEAEAPLLLFTPTELCEDETGFQGSRNESYFV